MVIKNQKIEMFNGSYAEYLARKDLAPSKGKEDAEKQILILQNRLSEIVGRLSMPSKQDNLEELDHEYHEIMGELKKLKASLENKN